MPASSRETGVVLWSRKLAGGAGPQHGRRRIPPSAGERRSPRRPSRTATADLTGKSKPHEIVLVRVEPFKRINYSLLHNNGKPVSRNSSSASLKPRPAFAAWRWEVRIARRPGQLSRSAAPLISLTNRCRSRTRSACRSLSSLIRRVDENLATTIYARVACGGENSL